MLQVTKSNIEKLTVNFISALTIVTFGGVASLIIGLEGDDIIHGFMNNYLSKGEPYLKTPHGSLLSYWDGTVHYLLLLRVLLSLHHGE